MTCEAFLMDVQALALGALEADEREAALRHLSHEGPHRGCAEAFARAQEAVLALSRLEQPLHPPAHALEPALGQMRAHRRRQRQTLVALAAGILVAWVATATVSRVRAEARTLAAGEETARLSVAKCARELDASAGDLRRLREVVGLLGAAGTRQFSLAPPKPSGTELGRATVLFNAQERRAVLVTHGLVPVAKKDYQLWVVRGGKPIAAGLVRIPPSGLALVDVGRELLQAGAPEAFAISLEDPGGGPAPKGPIVLAGALAPG